MMESPSSSRNFAGIADKWRKDEDSIRAVSRDPNRENNVSSSIGQMTYSTLVAGLSGRAGDAIKSSEPVVSRGIVGRFSYDDRFTTVEMSYEHYSRMAAIHASQLARFVSQLPSDCVIGAHVELQEALARRAQG